MAIQAMIFAVNDVEMDLIEQKISGENIRIIGKSTNLSGIVEETSKKTIDLVFVFCSDAVRASRACQQMYLLNPKIPCVLMSDNNSTEIANMAVDVGASGLINIDNLNRDAIYDKLKTILNNKKARANAFTDLDGTKRKAEVITVFGTKGGIGKTTLCVNLAANLAKKNYRVALLDFDLHFGDADVYLGIEANETVSDLLEDQRIPTIDSIRNFFITHSTGVQLLPAPISPEYAEGIIPSQLEQIINTIRPYYDYILIDTSSNFSDVNLLLLELSTKILYLTGLDISILRNSKKGLLLLDSLNQKGKINVILTRDIKSNISSKEVERILDCKILVKVPNDYLTAVSALNTGIPLIISSPKSVISKSIKEISDFISNNDEKKLNKKKKSLFRKGR